MHAIKTQHDVNELSSLFKEPNGYIQNDVNSRVLKKDKEVIEKKLRKVEGTLNVRKEEDKIIQGYKETMIKDKRLQDIFNAMKTAIEEDKRRQQRRTKTIILIIQTDKTSYSRSIKSTI